MTAAVVILTFTLLATLAWIYQLQATVRAQQEHLEQHDRHLSAHDTNLARINDDILGESP